MAGDTRELTIKDFKDTASREVKAINWPGTEKEVGLMFLHCGELQDCHLEARKYFRQKGQELDPFSHEELGREEDMQMVYRMLVQPHARVSTERIFKSVKEVRTHLTPEERNHFIGKHIDWQQETVKGWEPADEETDE